MSGMLVISSWGIVADMNYAMNQPMRELSDDDLSRLIRVFSVQTNTTDLEVYLALMELQKIRKTNKIESIWS